MTFDDSPRTRLVAWNGLRFSPPASWEPRVVGSRHLVFEEDFQPRLQLRWQRKAKARDDDLHRLAAALAGPAGSVGCAAGFPGAWLSIDPSYQLFLSLQGDDEQVAGGVCFCRSCHTLLQFQVFHPNHRSRLEVGRWLATLSCHGQRESLWRIQDFSLVTPAAFVLTNFNFGAGLTRLSFADRDLRLDICKLAPADIRLRYHTLAEILLTLCGAGDLVTWQEEGGESCQAMRTPGIAGWVLLRLHRQRPYLRALIRHDAATNRILAVILSANRRIAPELLPSLANRYEIVQEERVAKTADPN
jgi:hypothetical protein